MRKNPIWKGGMPGHLEGGIRQDGIYAFLQPID
jgi:hypothetical protein